NYEQPAHARQCGDDLLYHTISEVGLLGVSAQILKRQYCDGRPARKERGRTGDVRRRVNSFVRDLLSYLSLGHVAHEAEAFSWEGANEVLLLAAVANGLANGIDMAGERRFRNDASAPHGLDYAILAHHMIAVLNEVEQ